MFLEYAMGEGTVEQVITSYEVLLICIHRISAELKAQDFQPFPRVGSQFWSPQFGEHYMHVTYKRIQTCVYLKEVKAIFLWNTFLLKCSQYRTHNILFSKQDTLWTWMVLILAETGFLWRQSTTWDIQLHISLNKIRQQYSTVSERCSFHGFV